MSRFALLGIITCIVSISPAAAQEALDGTWKLISSKRTNQATGVTTDTFGTNPQGFIMYSRDGHMMVLLTQTGRPRADSIEKMTDQQREQLYSSMIAYAGTYKFDGKTMEHHVDISWNEMWTGTIQFREIARDGERLIISTRPQPSPRDGRMSITTLTWEKVK